MFNNYTFVLINTCSTI